MYAARTVSTYGWEEVVAVEADVRVFHFSTVLGEKHSACSWSIPHTQNVTLLQSRATRSGSEGIVVRLITVGMIAHRILTEAGKSERGVWLGRKTDGDVGSGREIEHLYLPVIYLIQLGKRQIRLDGCRRRRIRQESDLRPRVNQ